MTSTPVSFGGLESGLNTSAIISAEMQIFEQPLEALQTQQSTLNTQISDYQTINSQLLTLQQTADVLANPVAYDEAFSASSSNSSIATGTITSGSAPGSVTLAVDQLATGSTQISQGTVASTDDVVASGNILVGSGGSALGLASFTAGSGLSVGAHSISVTQASAGATVAAGTPLAASTTITGANDELDVDVNGSPLAVTIASGTYTAAQLAQAITSGSGGALSASVSSSGLLSIATTQQGSTASLQVTGGSALGVLGLSSGSTVYGTDGQIDVDGTTTTVNDIAGTGTTQVTLDSGNGGTHHRGHLRRVERGHHDGPERLGRRRLAGLGGGGHQRGERRSHGDRTPGGHQPVRTGGDVEEHGHGRGRHRRHAGLLQLVPRGAADDDGGAERHRLDRRDRRLPGHLPDQHRDRLAPRCQRQPGPGEYDPGDHHGLTGRLPNGEPGLGARQRGQSGALQHLDRYGLQRVDQHRRPPQRPDVA